MVVQGFAHPLMGNVFFTLAVVVGVPSQPHKILAALVVVGLVLVVLVLELRVHPIQVAAVAVLQDRVQLAATVALAS